MDFDLTDHHQQWTDHIRHVATTAIAPYRQEQDRAGTYHPTVLPTMAAAGLFAMRVPTDYGGLGLDTTSVGLALEELARADLSVCFPILQAALISAVMAENGTPEQLQRWLPPIAAGDAIVALALTEPRHGTDAANIELHAEETADGWRLSGEKTSIMVASHATHALVFARTSGPGARGITAFYVAMNDPGIQVTPHRDLGCRAGGRGHITFDRVHVGPSDLVSAPGNGFGAILKGFAVSRAWIALMALAVGQVCIDEALTHVAAREAFGQPLSRYQAVTFPLVEHTTLLHAARTLTLEALWCADHDRDPRVPTNMAKWWAPKVAADAAQQALLAFGHLGWNEDGPIAQRLRDVLGLQLADGTAAATKLVVARALLGRDKAP